MEETVVGTPPVETPPVETPPVETPPVDPELDLGEGIGKAKHSDIRNWHKSHGAYEGMKPMRDLDDFLSKPENDVLASAITSLIGIKDTGKITQVHDLLAGKLKLADATPEVADWEKGLDLTDPNVKALAGALKATQAQLKTTQDSHTTLTKDADERSKREQAARIDAQAKEQLEGVWKSEKYPDFLSRIHPDNAAKAEQELRKRLLFTVIQSNGKVPMAQVAKTLHGDTSNLIDGIVKLYAESLKKKPPQGGGGGPVGKPGTEATEDNLHERIKGTLAQGAT